MPSRSLIILALIMGAATAESALARGGAGEERERALQELRDARDAEKERTGADQESGGLFSGLFGSDDQDEDAREDEGN